MHVNNLLYYLIINWNLILIKYSCELTRIIRANVDMTLFTGFINDISEQVMQQLKALLPE